MRKKLWINKFFIFLCTFLLITGCISFNPDKSKVSATVNLPRIAIVGLDHSPFVEGDNNKFYISSKNFSGKVQYQLFYTCKELMGNEWALIDDGNMIDGWTKPSEANEAITVNLTDLNLKAGYYRFAIRVRRVGYKGKYENYYGDYDNAYPFTISVLDKTNIHLNGDMITNKTDFQQNEELVISGVQGAESDTLYKLHLYDVDNNKWLGNLTDYNKNINYNLNNLPAGAYLIDIWGKRSGSNKKYDGWKLKLINVKKETLPEVAIVGLDHSPFVEGDKNKFYISSKNFSGQVQYQLFYTCKELMGNNWALIDDGNMIDGWTKPAEANETVSVDLSKLDLKAGYYRFAIRVRRVGFKGKFENYYGDYDNAYPFTISVLKNSNVHLNGDMLINKRDFKKNDQLIINGVQGEDENTEYKLHLYDVTNNKWLGNLTEYDTEINYDLTNIPEGTYVVDIWSRKSNSNNKYDGWKLELINVTSEIATITNVEDIEATTWVNSNYKLPNIVSVVMEDGKTYNKIVNWKIQPDTSKEGTYTYEGSVMGYDKKVKLTLNIINGKGNASGNIINMGLVVNKGDWTYYFNGSDEGKLYKYNEKTEDIIKVCDDPALYINIVGDWIYYANYSEEGKGSVYKIKIDGTERTKINNDVSEHVIVKNDWIYYLNVSDELRIYKVRTDGTGRTKLNNDSSMNLNLENDYIYYTNMSDNNRAYRIKTDGTGRTKLTEDEAAFINVVDGYIYYANMSQGYCIYKMKTNGTGNVKLTNEAAAFLNVNDGWIYYSNLQRSNRLEKIKIDGTQRSTLNSSNTMLIQVIGDYIYYINGSDNDKLYRATKNMYDQSFFGVEIQEIEDIEQKAYLGGGYIHPLTVDAEMVDGSKKRFRVTWNDTDIDTNKPGEYTFQGTVKGYDKKVNLKVKVIGIDHLDKDIIERTMAKRNGVYVPNLNVKAVMEDGVNAHMKVKWSPSEISIDKVGTYTLEGTIEGYDKKQILKVTVIEIEDIVTDTFENTIPKGANFSMPSSTGVVMNDGSMDHIDIKWTPSTLDTNVVGEHIFEGRIANYDGKLSLKVTVVEEVNTVSGDIVAKDGDWIYYNNMYDDNNIYKIKSDGTGKTMMLYRGMKILKIEDGWIYYNGWDLEDPYTQIYLHRMRTDGTDNMRIVYSEPDKIEIMGDWIYYYIYAGDTICKVPKDGSGKEVVLAKKAYSMDIDDEWLYYINRNNNDYYIYKMKLDGTGKVQLSNKSTRNIIVCEDWIYYVSYGSYYKSEYKLYKIRKDGTEEQLLLEALGDSLGVWKVQGDWIYVSSYCYDTQDDEIWKLKTDGTEKTLLDKEIRSLRRIYLNEELLCYQDDYDIYIMKTDGTDKIFAADLANIVNVVDGWIYYKSLRDSVLYKMKFDGTEIQMVY